MVAQLVTATLQNVVVCNQPDSCTDGDVLMREQMRLVLQLAVALWGDLPTDCDPGRPMQLYQDALIWGRDSVST